MRQGNEIEACPAFRDGKAATNHIFQFYERNEVRDGQSADRNNETWLQDLNLVVYP